MKNLPLEDIIPENLTEDEVELHLPRFSVHSNMYINKVLNQVSFFPLDWTSKKLLLVTLK